MHAHRGFALAAALMVLALLSVLGAAAIQSTSLEVQISAHDRDARAALYVAQSALEEARYYAARGWGKIGPPTLTTPSTATVAVTTADLPASIWAADLYQGFTLVDRVGQAYTITTHGGPTPRELTLDTIGHPAPSAGPFTILREIPTATWDGTELVVSDGPWALVSGSNTWLGWVVWDAAGAGHRVTGSGRDLMAAPARVLLSLGTAPGPGPYTLTYNPWVAGLTSNLALPGDATPATGSWDRVFSDGAGTVLGTAGVTAVETGPGAFTLLSVGTTGTDRSVVEAHLRRAGWRTQTITDWKVGGQ